MADRRRPGQHLGLDLGGTNIKWVVAERANGAWRVLHRGQLPTRGETGPEGVTAQLASLCAEAIARHPSLASVGIGVPGLYDPETGVTGMLPNLPGQWEGQPVAVTVSSAVGLPVRLINDARAFGLAELRLGAGRGASAMVGITLGTGVGGVVAIGGRVHQGHQGTAGELGHQTLEPDGPQCNCGNRGCLEAYARADAIEAACGATTVEHAVELARAGDERALEGFARVGAWLGIGIANLVVVLTPDRIVLGGGVAAASDLLIPHIWDELRRRVFVTSIAHLRIVTAELGTWAGAIGAAVHGAEAAGA